MIPYKTRTFLLFLLFILLGATARAEEYEYHTVVFQSFPGNFEVKEEVIRYCGVPVGFSTWASQPGTVIEGLSPNLSSKLAVGIYFGKGYERFAKQDTQWAINSKQQLVLIKPGTQELSGVPVIKTILSDAVIARQQKQNCQTAFTSQELQRIAEVEKASIAFATAFESGVVDPLQSFLEKNKSLQMSTTHSLDESASKRRQLKGSAAVLDWIQKVHAGLSSVNIPRPVGQKLYSCNAQSCQFGFAPILHNNLFLTETHVRRIADKTILTGVHLYDGD